jgi:hypothetical protein
VPRSFDAHRMVSDQKLDAGAILPTVPLKRFVGSTYWSPAAFWPQAGEFTRAHS